MPTDQIKLRWNDRDGEGTYCKAADATIIGALAVHYSEERASWTITHVATGYRVYGRFFTYDLAYEAAERLNAAFDWSSSNPRHYRHTISRRRVLEILAPFNWYADVRLEQLMHETENAD